MQKNKLLIVQKRFNKNINYFKSENLTIVDFSSQDFYLKVNVKNNINNIINVIAIIQSHNKNHHIEYSIINKQNKININVFFIVLNDAKINSTLLIKNTKASKNNEVDMKAHGLILDSKSKIDIKPIFNFLSNQINAKHSVKIGTININELDYLKSRGIKQTKAEFVLSQSKINSILKYIDQKQRNKIMMRINEIIGK